MVKDEFFVTTGTTRVGSLLDQVLHWGRKSPSYTQFALRSSKGQTAVRSRPNQASVVNVGEKGNTVTRPGLRALAAEEVRGLSLTIIRGISFNLWYKQRLTAGVAVAIVT